MTTPSMRPTTLSDLLSHEGDSQRIAEQVARLAAGRPARRSRFRHIALSRLSGPRRSRWFVGTCTPWTPGVYECMWTRQEGGASVLFNFWDGTAWHWGRQTPDDALVGAVKDRGARHPRVWRGVSSPPGALRA